MKRGQIGPAYRISSVEEAATAAGKTILGAPAGSLLSSRGSADLVFLPHHLRSGTNKKPFKVGGDKRKGIFRIAQSEVSKRLVVKALTFSGCGCGLRGGGYSYDRVKECKKDSTIGKNREEDENNVRTVYNKRENI